MKRRAQSPLLDEERPRRTKKPYRGDDLRGAQKLEASIFFANPPSAPIHTTRIDLDEPIPQPSYTNGQQMWPEEPQDVEMAMGGNSQEMYFDESQTDDGGSQMCASPSLLYNNTILDIMSPWAQRWHRHDIEGGEVFYQPEVIPLGVANAWYQALDALDTWYQPTLTVYGRPHVQPRSIAAYVVDPSLPAPKYSNHKVTLHHPYPPVLQHIQGFVSRTLGVGFDHVMLNHYASGNVGIGKHRDTKENQVIAVLSLGAERTFVMTPQMSSSKTPKVRCGDRKWTLGNGSLLVMQGDTQKNWKHEIPKEAKVREGRISLTFRQIVHA